MIWLINAVSGKVMANMVGHEEEVLYAEFTKHDKGKHIVSCSSDKTLRVWSPMKNECLATLRDHSSGGKNEFHKESILCFALHPTKPVVISGDESGEVYASQFMTGEVHGKIGTHADNVESITISDTQPIAASAGIDNKIFIYDLNNFTIRLTVNIGEFGGFTKLLFSKQDENCILAASTMGDLSLVDYRNGQVTKTFKGHEEALNDFKEINLFGQEMIVTGGDDNKCLIFDKMKQ